MGPQGKETTGLGLEDSVRQSVATDVSVRSWSDDAALTRPSIQLVFSNFYLGIALGALDFSVKCTVYESLAVRRGQQGQTFRRVLYS
jgi:hypothetical protein